MEHARPLPPYLVDALPRLAGPPQPRGASRATPRRAGHGQNPKAMIITCCDSRVLVSEIFGNEPGDFFIHRNIANLVPPHEPDGRAHGTSAAIEYAVIALGIEHLIVMGHHGCGGVRGCHDMLAGLAPDLDTPDELRRHLAARSSSPATRRCSGRGLDYEARIAALEKEAVLVSLAQPDDLPLRARGGRRPAGCSSTASGRTSATATSRSTTPRPAPSRRSEPDPAPHQARVDPAARRVGIDRSRCGRAADRSGRAQPIGGYLDEETAHPVGALAALAAARLRRGRSHRRAPGADGQQRCRRRGRRRRC